MNSRPASARWLLLFIPAGLAAGIMGLWWMCDRDDSVPYLPGPTASMWILYPRPTDTTPHTAQPMSADFHREFVIDSLPTSAGLRVRVFREGAVSINGKALSRLSLSGHGWKRVQSAEVSGLLRQGRNEITATVTNSHGPPALWLQLDLPGKRMVSDSGWKVSLAGAEPQPALSAALPPSLRPGNYLYGLETMSDSIRKVWPAAVVLIGCIGVLMAIAWALLRRRDQSAETTRQWNLRLPMALLAFIMLTWLALFVNNIPQLPGQLGFDRDGHLQYMDYILQKKKLPLADEGWQMYQPPFYYLAAAGLLAPFADTASTDSAVVVLRYFSAATGLANIVMIFLCLRLVFPTQPTRQCLGMLLAAFLPAQLCLSHHVSNESLGALLASISIYCCLRVFRADQLSWQWFAAAGGALGLGLLTKFSAVLLVPLVLGSLGWSAWRAQGAMIPSTSRADPLSPSPAQGHRLAWLGFPAIALISMLAVCGWHFARVWLRFGNPLIGNWDPGLPFAWWQDPGCHTFAWCAHFGGALQHPFFGSLWGFPDGLYTTLWGDGLCSASARASFRPPWNYDWMNAGYLLAVPITVLLVAGLFSVAEKMWRRLETVWVLFPGALVLFGLGILVMSLKVASYAQVKAFYALPALGPLCAIGVLGWDRLSGKRMQLRAGLAGLVISWAAVSYWSFWIRNGNPMTHIMKGTGFTDDGRYQDAAASFSRALELDPSSLPARTGLADALVRGGRRVEAAQTAQIALKEHPEDSTAHIRMGVSLGLSGDYASAAREFEAAINLAPDHPLVYQQLATCFAQLKSPKDVIQTCRRGLRVNPFSPELHSLLASALASQGQWAEAIVEYRQTLRLVPEKVDTLNNLAWILATNPDASVRDGQEATRLAQKACALTENREPMLLGTLAAAFAEQGDFPKAIATAEKAESLARDAGQIELAERNKDLLQLYRKSKPYRLE